MMLVPRIIHQTAPAFDRLPAEVTAAVDRMREANPRWEYRFYDDAALRDYLADALGAEAMKLCDRVNPRLRVVLADLFRYVVIHREGGLYLDIKSTALRPLDKVIRPDDVFLLSQWRNRVGERYQGWGIFPDLWQLPGGEFEQWYVCAAPGHPFLARVIEDVLRNMADYSPAWHGRGKMGVLRVSGPICFSLAISPIAQKYRFRLIDAQSAGLVYSTNADARAHMRDPKHYSRYHGPVMLPDARVPVEQDIFARQAGSVS